MLHSSAFRFMAKLTASLYHYHTIPGKYGMVCTRVLPIKWHAIFNTSLFFSLSTGIVVVVTNNLLIVGSLSSRFFTAHLVWTYLLLFCIL